MTDVDEPWNDAVAVEEMGGADFESRTAGLSIYDSDGTLCQRVLALEWDLSRAAKIDRVMRIYLSKLIDEGEVDIDRGEYEITTLIPPEGWVEANIDPPLVSVDIEEDEAQSVSASIPSTVKEIIDTIVEDQEVFESRTALAREAIEWLTEAE